MPHTRAFRRLEGSLFCEDIPLATIAAQTGTPTYVYSKTVLLSNLELFQGAFPEIECQICYSVKSCSNLSILNLLASRGVGADIVSGGELFRAMKAGIDPKKIVYSGVGKTADEIRMALRSGIRMFNIESEPELELISRIAVEEKRIAPIAFRVNPDVDAKTHQKTTTGKKENKFGVPWEQAVDLYLKANNLPNINPVGIDVHLGSPIFTLEPYQAALERLTGLILELREKGVPIQTLDIGGGYAIVYNNEEPFTPVQFANLITPFLKKTGCRLIIEPGRFIAGNAATLLTRVTYVKKTPTKTFYICDAGMNDLIRPAFYDSYHRITPVQVAPGAAVQKVDVVGPICESSDCFAKDREIEEVKEGDLLAIMSAGAYGFAMSSQYNSRPRSCEVLVDGESFRVIRKRETYEDLIAGEAITW